MRLFEAGRLLPFSAFRMGAYSRWALIRGCALIRINTVAVSVKRLRYQFLVCNHVTRRPCWWSRVLFFSQEFISKWCSLPGGEKCFVLDPARTWSP